MEEKPEAKLWRLFRRRGALVTASALGVVLGLGTAWAFRAPLAGVLIQSWLGGAGVDGTFSVARVDLGGIALSSISLGPAANPDFTADAAKVRLAWAPFPRLAAVRLVKPHLRARVYEQGVSVGALDGLLRGGARPGGPLRLPQLALEITDGHIDLETPFGLFSAYAWAEGRIGQDFSARASLIAADTARIEDAHGLLLAQSTTRGVSATLTFSAARGASQALSFEGFAGTASFAAKQDFQSAEAQVHVSFDRAIVAALHGANFIGDLELRSATDPSLRSWSGAAVFTVDEMRDGVAPHIDARHVQANANIAVGPGHNAIRTAWRVRGEGVALTPNGRAVLVRAWPALGALPIGPLAASAREATLVALTNTSFDAPFRVALGDRGVTLEAVSPITAQSASGARLTITPRASSLSLGERGGIDGSGVIAIAGGGFPTAVLDIAKVHGGQGSLIRADGTIRIPGWRAAGAELAARDLAFRYTQTETGNRLVVSGPALVSGPLGGAAAVRDLQAPLNLALDWGAGLRVAPVGDLCMTARFAEFTLPGLVFRDGLAPICAEQVGFLVSDERTGVGGGVSIAALALTGHVQGNAQQRAALQVERIGARFSGTSARLVLDATVDAPHLRVTLAPDHPVDVTGARIVAQMVTAQGTWRAAGRLEDGAVDDPTLPANVKALNSDWRAAPRGGDTVIVFENGAAKITERAADGASGDRIPAFHDMRTVNMRATLAEGRLVAEGALVLAKDAHPIGLFEASHNLETGAGDGVLRIRDLSFSPGLQPYQLSELARSVVANVEGPVSADINAHWTPTAFAADGSVRADNLSFATATMPIVENVSGEVVFDDLLAMTTPPRQRVTVGAVNPGVEVRNGVIEFQLLPEGRVAVQRAEWPFANGVLAVAPTEIVLGAPETRLKLTLTDVDVAVLLAQLNVPDLAATGRVAGQFPLVLTPDGSRIENGTLAATQGGGEIYYAGAAAREATGVARLAFQALTRFRYDDLSLELNGDLDGELVTAINFSGRNAGDLDIGAGATGPLQATVAGVPFIFNVRVTAPFRRLSEMAAGAFDPRQAIHRAGQASQKPRPQVDRPAPATE